jgi:hypothetical protein
VRQAPRHGHVRDALPQARTDTHVDPVGKGHGYPELLIAGLPPEIAHALLNDLAGRVYDKAERFSHGQRITDLIAGYDAVIVQGPATDDLLPGAAFARYGREHVQLQQVVWPDRAGRFPWQPGYTFDPHAQPLIAEP